MPHQPSLSRTLLFLLPAVLAACARTPPPAPQCPAAPAAPAAAVAPPAPAPAVPAQESLVRFVPADAAAAVVVRRGAFDLPRRIIDAMPAFHVELGEYLVRELGVDLTGIEGMAAYSMDGGASSAAFLRLVGPRRSAEPHAGGERLSGVELMPLGKDVFGAVLDGGIAVGTRAGVAVAIDLAQGRRAAARAAADNWLGRALEADAAEVDMAVGIDVARMPTGERGAILEAGVRAASLQYRRDGLMTLRIEGKPDKLEAIIPLYAFGMQAGLQKLRKEKEEAVEGHDLAKAIGALMAFHGAEQVAVEIAPRMEGGALVSSYRLPRMDSGATLASWIGVAAAVAVPAVQKYMKRSKTTEAATNVPRITSAAIAYHEQFRSRGRQFTFPATTPWTAETTCCGAGRERCPAASSKDFDHPTWKALGFDPGEGHRFQYRFVSTGKGESARFTIEARADLDCKGTPSTFRQSGSVSAGNVVVNQLERPEDP